MLYQLNRKKQKIAIRTRICDLTSKYEDTLTNISVSVLCMKKENTDPKNPKKSQKQPDHQKVAVSRWASPAIIKLS